MSAFAENPFFFFMDHASPISTVNNSKSPRRIVELSDTGCDARLSVSSLLRNATRYYSSKSAKMRSSGNWRANYEERFGGKYAQNGGNYDGLYFMPKEAESEQSHWREYSTYEDRDFRLNSRITPERIRQSTRYSPNHSQLPRFNHHRTNYGMHEEAFRRRTTDYPENPSENPRNSNNRKDPWQRIFETTYDTVSRDIPRPNSKKTTDDRRKRTQTVPKVFYENAESQYDVRTFQNSGCMTTEQNRSKFVDRAVDKDSLSDILESNAPTESPEVKEEENKQRNSFWEFISLEDDDQKKSAPPSWLLKTNSKKKDAVDKVETGFIGKTVAQLKRKLEKTKVDESVSQIPVLPTEKKIRSEVSRLPVRIGGRQRSKNPIAARIRNSFNPPTVGKEENEDTNCLERNSARSRTKPKEKPSVLQNEVVLGHSEGAEYSKSEGNVQETMNIGNFSSRNQKGDEELRAGADDVISGSKMMNLTGDQRGNEIVGKKNNRNGNVTREMEISRGGLKENCFLHLHDEENVVCNTHCKKDCRKSHCLENRKLVGIKSRL